MELDLNNSKNEFPSIKKVYSFKCHEKSKSFEKNNNKKKSPQNKRLKSINNEKSYKIGNYFIKKTIGSGNFGKVKLGIYIPTGEKVAIKIIPKSKMKEKDDLIRLERELEILTKFEHPNIIMVNEIFESENSYYTVMDFCEGGELFNYIVKKKFLSEDESSFFYYQIINGLEYIHSLGIVHRDLKPENLLLTKDHILKIIDFGLSNYYKQGKDKLLFTPCGSPCYASPEMIKGDFYDGTKIDIWCTGIILFAMLCGYLPFEDKNNTKMFKEIVECKVNYPKYLSESSVDLLKKIIVPNPKDRISINEIKKHPFFLKGKKLFDEEFTIFYLGKKLNSLDNLDNINTKSKENINEKKLNNASKENNQKDTIIEDHIINISVNDNNEINNIKNNKDFLKQIKERNKNNKIKELSSFNKTFDNTDKKMKINLNILTNKNQLRNNILKLREKNLKVLNTDIKEDFFPKYNLKNTYKINDTRNKKKKLRINSLNIAKMNTNKNRNIKKLKIKTILSTGKSESVETKPSLLNKFNLKKRNDKFTQKRKNTENKFLRNFLSKIKLEKREKSSEVNTNRKKIYDLGNAFYIKKYTKIMPNNLVRIKRELKLKNHCNKINTKNQKDISKTIDITDILEKNKINISLKPIITRRKLNYFNGMRLTLNSNNINNMFNKCIKNKEKKNNNLSTEFKNYLSEQNSKDFDNIKNNIIRRKKNNDIIDKYNLNNFGNVNDIINKKIKHKLNLINSENIINKHHKLFTNKISKDKLTPKINNNNFTQKILIYNNYIYNTSEKKQKNKKLDENQSLIKYAASTTQTWMPSENQRNKPRKNDSKKKYIKVFTKPLTTHKETLKVNRKKVSNNISKSLLSIDISNNTTLRNAHQNNNKKMISLNDSKKIKIRINKNELNNQKMSNKYTNDFNIIDYMKYKNLIKSKNSRKKNNEMNISSNKTTNRENTYQNLLNKGLKYIKINNKYIQNNMILNNRQNRNETSKKRKNASNNFCETYIKSKLNKIK